MATTPVVSVIMSVYNEPLEWLHQSINSILQQTFNDYEFIILCDNPSYFEGISLLNEYAKKDSRIILIFNEMNIGLTKSLNKGLSVAKGEYIARMDADDFSMPERFEKQLLYMTNHPEMDLCHTNYAYINENSIIKCRRVSDIRSATQDYLFWHNNIAHPTVMFRRKVLGFRRPLYNEGIRVGQDYELWTVLTAEGYNFGFVDDVLLQYRLSINQISKNKLEEQHKNTLKIRKELILLYLQNNEIWHKEDGIGSQFLFNSIKAYFDSTSSFDSIQVTCLLRIQYLLYYTLASQKSIYIRYFFRDKRMKQLSLDFKDKLRIYIAPLLGWKYDTMRVE